MKLFIVIICFKFSLNKITLYKHLYYIYTYTFIADSALPQHFSLFKLIVLVLLNMNSALIILFFFFFFNFFFFKVSDKQ